MEPCVPVPTVSPEFAFRTGADTAPPRPRVCFYTHLVEGETLNHGPFLRILPGGQRALGPQQVMDLLVVHLQQEKWG